MSITYHLCCKDCGYHLWIGQGDYIYTGQQSIMDDLTRFLYAHLGHALEFMGDYAVDRDDEAEGHRLQTWESVPVEEQQRRAVRYGSIREGPRVSATIPDTTGAERV